MLAGVLLHVIEAPRPVDRCLRPAVPPRRGLRSTHVCDGAIVKVDHVEDPERRRGSRRHRAARPMSDRTPCDRGPTAGLPVDAARRAATAASKSMQYESSGYSRSVMVTSPRRPVQASLPGPTPGTSTRARSKRNATPFSSLALAPLLSDRERQVGSYLRPGSNIPGVPPCRRRRFRASGKAGACGTRRAETRPTCRTEQATGAASGAVPPPLLNILGVPPCRRRRFRANGKAAPAELAGQRHGPLAERNRRSGKVLGTG